MNFDKYTVKSQEVLQKSAEICTLSKQQIIAPGHLLKAISAVDENPFTFINKKLGVYTDLLINRLDEILARYPKSSGANPYFSNDTATALQAAETYMHESKDSFIAVEHLLLGILTGKDSVAALLKTMGYSASALQKSIAALRGGKKVNDQKAESQYRSLARYSQNLNALAKNGKIDPIIGRDDEIRAHIANTL